MIVGILKIIGIILAVYTIKSIFTNRINRRWRKRVVSGDKCFFINMMNGRSYGFVYDVNMDTGKVLLQQRAGGHKDGRVEASGWYHLENLRIK